MNVDRAKQIARAEISQYPELRRLSARVLADECDRLEVRLESVRLELAATVANIAAWDDVLADVIPALHDQMGND